MRPLLTLLSPEGRRGRLSILIFHRVLPRPDPLFPDEICSRTFDRICAWLARDFNVLSLSQAVQLLREGSLPARAAAMTFDDGYADNETIALPILRRHGLPATFFIATGFLDGGRMWNDTVIEAIRATRKDMLDLSGAGLAGLGRLPVASVADRRAAITQILGAAKYLPVRDRLLAVERVAGIAAVAPPDDLMMRSEQIRTLHAAGMEIGAHTVSHPILAGLAAAEVRAEVGDGRQRLQALTQSPVTLFAYPNGRPGQDYDEGAVRLVREMGFEAAVSTAWGAAGASSDLYQLPRFTPWDRSRTRFGLRLARNLMLPPRVVEDEGAEGCRRAYLPPAEQRPQASSPSDWLGEERGHVR